MNNVCYSAYNLFLELFCIKHVSDERTNIHIIIQRSDDLIITLNYSTIDIPLSSTLYCVVSALK